MELEQPLAAGHVAAAVAALVTGAVVVGFPKGVGKHRVVGGVYIGGLVLVDIAALAIHRESAFGVFHALAVVSLLTVAAGVGPLLAGTRSPWAVANHAYCMAASYAGLLAAGAGQLATHGTTHLGGWIVPGAIAATLLVSGVVIAARVPPALQGVLGAD